ncbi:transcriptional regulator [Sphingobium jiangsuense]|uniref:DNA-binding IclR family transcriptional regulator n=1 Tax=Sphingobium jiangsuense TaxID=870476 RepID=A0A7W6BQ96_9SPHN|nr:helix-turn-helix domain-containing protein [Sphingobium jiangsuense]MBB3925884.1 DNA-binding IclR family transcriptional regulator [Sphingobium jiangsuense]GLS98691.1 transcriptional regulator [Sphingobium jiangsuense]
MVTSASRTIKSAHRVLEILEYFDQDRRHATVMDMSRTLKYPQSSTSELLRCLTRLGYLHYNRFRRTYSPTARVALLGAWVKPSLFRGGPVLSAIDEIAEETNETVLLSTNANYVVQHLHVLHGNAEGAIDAHGGDTRPVLHSPQGRLLLSSYRNEHIRSAVHRLNADEPDPARHVKISDVVSELSALREKGWIIAQEEDGTGCVAVLLPHRRHMDRLAISIQARSEVIEERGEEMLALLLRQRDRLGSLCLEEDGTEEMNNVVRLPDPPKIVSYRRHFA